MAMPKFYELFDDVLSVLADGSILHRREIYDAVLTPLDLTPDERLETNPGGSNRSKSRVHWALEFLCQSGAVKRPSRGYAEITDLGRDLMNQYPDGVTLQVLKQTDGYRDWKARSKSGKLAGGDASPAIHVSDDDDTSTPLEKIESAIGSIEASIASQLLERLREEDPAFLEKIVLRLLHAMGYGNSHDDLKHLGGSGDGGVDGVIRQDKLGLDEIYVQAKRYSSGSIGRPDLQSFVGALTGKHATRGVFITTSSFTKDAREFAKAIPNFRVVLIDGEELVKLMIFHKVGVRIESTVELVGIDENFFADD